MASKRVSSQEAHELDKLIKILAVKAIQVVVQSRLGNKIRTYCKPFSYANDYFGIAVNCVPDVLTETKRIFQNVPITSRLPLSVEISLKTADGNSMVLESWTLGLIPKATYSNPKVFNHLFIRMSLMLKSLISITRVMPAYKMSRKQDADSYTIFYKLHLGEYDNRSLGDDFKEFKFSRLTCCRGILFMSVKYRTNMVIAPQQISNKTAEVIAKPKRTVDLTKPMKLGAFVDTTKIKEFTDSNLVFPDDPPCSWLLELAQGQYDCEYMKINEVEIDNKAEDALQAEEEKKNIKIERKRTWTINDDDDSKFMKELNCPFATASPIGELAIFYREFYHAPPLQAFEDLELNNLAIEDICDDPHVDVSKQIKKLEDSLQDYDQIVTDLCQYSNEYI
ncbi:autophagy-related protein 13 homolog [Arctopsyche grandis]|uniref:autophagy-related protein 13 homolog n=1 Tax=Arctopsyche grandis TaxID=121162 RepID=UPI00406D8AD6